MPSVTDLISGLNAKSTVSSKSEDQKREPTQFWVNVGVERQGKLVSLPMGIPLDKLTARKVPGTSTKNTEFRNLRLAEAKLWGQIKAIMEQLKPGQEVTLPLTVKLRRCAEQENVDEVDQSENPFDVGDIMPTSTES